MTGKPVIMKIDKPHFVVKLHEDVLEVDLKEGAKKHLEDVVEANPILRESLGVLFQTIIPLDVALKDIKSVKVDNKGRLQIVMPLRRDLHIPLESEESERLAEKLNELIPLAKLKDAQRMSRLSGAEEGRTRVSRVDE
ncbi:MAG: hypothetical protein ABSF24_11410 [Candidatus Bathyarchaeia archaeon]|jgi:hypothetical protein